MSVREPRAPSFLSPMAIRRLYARHWFPSGGRNPFGIPRRTVNLHKAEARVAYQSSPSVKAAVEETSAQTPRLEAAIKSSMILAGRLENFFCAAARAERRFLESRNRAR